MTEETVILFAGPHDEPSSALHKRVQMVLLINGMMTRALIALHGEEGEAVAPLLDLHRQLDREIEAMAQEISRQ